MKVNNPWNFARFLTKATELLIDAEAELAIIEADLLQREIDLDHLWNEVCFRRGERVVVNGLIEEVQQKAQ